MINTVIADLEDDILQMKSIPGSVLKLGLFALISFHSVIVIYYQKKSKVDFKKIDSNVMSPAHGENYQIFLILVGISLMFGWMGEGTIKNLKKMLDIVEGFFL